MPIFHWKVPPLDNLRHIGYSAAMRSKCIVCGEPNLKRQSEYCANCFAAKIIIQRSATAMLDLHGIVRASGMCVDCGVRPATCRDHRHYAAPLKVDFVCTACNTKRGAALDLHELIKAHRGMIVITEPQQDAPAASSQVAQLKDSLKERELAMILAALEQTKWNRTQAAKVLGITFRALRYRMEKLGI